jgi:hypothetical protein
MWMPFKRDIIARTSRGKSRFLMGKIALRPICSQQLRIMHHLLVALLAVPLRYPS